MSFNRLLLSWCVFLLTGLAPSLSSAHLISAGSGSISIQSDKTTLLMGVPASLFSGIDLDGDGLLQPEEIRSGRTRMIEQLQLAIQLRLGDQAGTVIDEQLMVSVRLDQRNSTNQIEWLRFLKFPPEALSQPITVSMAPQALTNPYILQVHRFDDAETAVLSPQYPRHTYLKNAWSTFTAFVEQGILHILAGLDHVVFLLTLLTAAVSVRRWLVVLTTFTLAHGVTYGLATFGVLQVSPQLIEPVIALTIMLAAGVHLMGWRPALSVEASAVFSLGLFHGLGFASSMAEIFKEQRYPLSSVLGFNVGVEIGQVAIAGLLALFMAALSKTAPPWRDPQLLARVISMVAMLVGAYWFVERVWF
jgi:hydrogenase/urease accessory protein HupE